MRFLIDTNVLISSEPTRPTEIEEGTEASLALARLASGRHQLLLHPSVTEEIAHDSDPDRRRLRQRLVDRYPLLGAAPPVTPDMEQILGGARQGSHDWYDHLLLAAVVTHAVHGLVTQDVAIHRKAERLSVADRVYYLADAVAALEAFARHPPAFIPQVEYLPLHSINLSDPFFDSLREDYPGFDDWFRSKAADGREAFVIFDPDGACAGLCALKPADDELGLGGEVTKISTLKVAEKHKGNRYGELLLKAMFRHVHRNRDDALWVTVFPRHGDLLDLLHAFGFRDHGEHPTGEVRLVKRLRPPPGDLAVTAPLDCHVTYGPPSLKILPEQTFVVPIRPEYHLSLFPDAPPFEPQEQLALPGLEVRVVPRAHGNALRKAYLCHAGIRTLKPGATLLFYRSSDARAVTTVGVLEHSLASSDEAELVDYVGTRTVYSADEVAEMAARSPVLALRFRQDRFLEPPISVDQLIGARAISRAPQTIQRLNLEGIPWLTAHLGG